MLLFLKLHRGYRLVFVFMMNHHLQLQFHQFHHNMIFKSSSVLIKFLIIVEKGPNTFFYFYFRSTRCWTGYMFKSKREGKIYYSEIITINKIGVRRSNIFSYVYIILKVCINFLVIVLVSAKNELSVFIRVV